MDLTLSHVRRGERREGRGERTNRCYSLETQKTGVTNMNGLYEEEQPTLLG